MKKLEVGILGATGTVGRELIRRLEDHPWFSLAEVGASDSSAGGTLAGLTLKKQTDEWSSPVLFSALPAAVARELEPELARRGHHVVSNASAHRMTADVPLVVPEVNADHLALLDRQNWSGSLVTNPNCAVAVMVIALAPLARVFGIDRLVTTSLQAVSGAGRPGPPASDLMDNVLPYIGGEESKLETEPQRILGTVEEGVVVPEAFDGHATCTRVNVLHGHTVSMTLRTSEAVERERVLGALRSGDGLRRWTELPSSPEHVLLVHDDVDRPQPRVDRDLGGAMTVSVGRVRVKDSHTVSLVAMGHNLGRGAAGAALLNAELLRHTERLG